MERGEGEHVELGGQEEEEGREVEPQGEGEIPEQRGRTREDEEDLRFKDDLDTRRSRQEGRVDSLQNLTLKCISDNTDYFLDHPEDIHSLPGPLFRLVADHLVETADKTELPDILPLVISEKTWKLDILFSMSSKPQNVWNPDSLAKVFELIEEKCKHTLTHLGLRYLSLLHPMPINTIFASLENLTTLDLFEGNFGVTDDTLLVLGQNCLKLSCLVLYRIKEITDTGVNHLYPPYGHCTNLETLDLAGTSVTVDGLVTALSNFPKLKDLRNFNCLYILDKFVKINGVTVQLQIQELCYDDGFLTPVDLENVCKIVPHATTVTVFSAPSLHAFFNINAIEIFQLEKSDISSPDLNSFITHFSSSLTSVFMWYFRSGVDLSVFGSCPNLEVLVLTYCPILSTNQFQLVPNSFMKLKELTVKPRFAPVATNLELIVSQMLSSPTLCSFFLLYITFPEASLYSLIVEAKETQSVFSNLEIFQIQSNEYSLDTLKQLICVCPKLSVLCFRMSQESKLQLRRFVERNNLPHIGIY